MKAEKEKILTIALTMCFAVVFLGAGVLSDSEAVTVSWVVPADTTFSLAWAGSETEINFDDDIDGMNFTNAAPDSQTGATPIINLTNNGNTEVDVKMLFNASLYDDGINYVNVSVGDNTNSSKFWWEGQNGADNASTNNQTVKADLAIGATVGFWVWTCGVEVEQTAVDDDLMTLQITTVDS